MRTLSLYNCFDAFVHGYLYQKAYQHKSRRQFKMKLLCRAMDSALHELHELVSRNKRSLEAAENALLPVELKQALW